MPRLSFLGVRLAPLAQRIVAPLAAFGMAKGAGLEILVSPASQQQHSESTHKPPESERAAPRRTPNLSAQFDLAQISRPRYGLYTLRG